MKVISADHLVPVTTPPVVGGAVAFADDRIVAVGKFDEIRARFPDAEYEHFGAAAILPGFVNCHAHLELTAMRGFLDAFDDDFPKWLLTLTRVRREHLDDRDIADSAMIGAVEAARAGVTTIADIGREAQHGMTAIKSVGLRGISFVETEFTPDNRFADGDFARLIERFEAVRDAQTPLVRAGISPHSPYTVSSRLVEQISEFSVSNAVPVTIHAAESLMEKELLESGTGFMSSVYGKFGFEWSPPGCSPVEYLARHGALAAKPVLAHCVQVSEADIELIANAGARIAHCPKSNAKFGHGRAPLRKFADAGINFGIGSDSVASNNICDLIEEARFASLVARYDDGAFFAAPAIIRMMTLGGAEALGMESEIGSLEAGKSADFAVVSLSSAAHLPVHDPLAAIAFSASAQDVVATFVGGRELFSNGKVIAVDESALRFRAAEIAAKIRN